MKIITNRDPSIRVILQFPHPPVRGRGLQAGDKAQVVSLLGWPCRHRSLIQNPPLPDFSRRRYFTSFSGKLLNHLSRMATKLHHPMLLGFGLVCGTVSVTTINLGFQPAVILELGNALILRIVTSPSPVKRALTHA